ncbi:MAG: SDR family NAD(P)-dependent oxidoreductase [Proteobacteria bacterium]|nr:SDR family NAD(P)-dependent oxidoreductase [Pseudomonadota bacterium]MDA1355161.1 SDR family NAD(P)-dependent oxidoreductase [Pseudomonadota bacterium]
MTDKRLDGRIALVTGASRGIGRAVARRFAAEGARLILVARTSGGLEEADDEVRSAGGEPAMLVPLDICKGGLVDQLGAALHERFGRLDILVGNAAMLGGLRPVGHYPPDVWEDVIALNLTANWRLIRSLDPLLRLSDAGRAMFVTSGVTEGTPPAYWGAYTASKAALEALVFTYAAELKRTNLKANIIDPGASATNMRAEAFPGEDPNTLATPDEITERFVELAESKFSESGVKVFV